MRLQVARSHAYRDFHNRTQPKGVVWEEKLVAQRTLAIATALYIRAPLMPVIDCGGPITITPEDAAGE